jgi:hypothetical protein
MVFIAAGRPIAGPARKKKRKRKNMKTTRFQPSTFRHPFALGAWNRDRPSQDIHTTTITTCSPSLLFIPPHPPTFAGLTREPL